MTRKQLVYSKEYFEVGISCDLWNFMGDKEENAKFCDRAAKKLVKSIMRGIEEIKLLENIDTLENIKDSEQAKILLSHYRIKLATHYKKITKRT